MSFLTAALDKRRVLSYCIEYESFCQEKDVQMTEKAIRYWKIMRCRACGLGKALVPGVNNLRSGGNGQRDIFCPHIHNEEEV